jgi:hypothetical protein
MTREISLVSRRRQAEVCDASAEAEVELVIASEQAWLGISASDVRAHPEALSSLPTRVTDHQSILRPLTMFSHGRAFLPIAAGPIPRRAASQARDAVAHDRDLARLPAATRLHSSANFISVPCFQMAPAGGREGNAIRGAHGDAAGRRLLGASGDAHRAGPCAIRVVVCCGVRSWRANQNPHRAGGQISGVTKVSPKKSRPLAREFPSAISPRSLSRTRLLPSWRTSPAATSAAPSAGLPAMAGARRSPIGFCLPRSCVGLIESSSRGGGESRPAPATAESNGDGLSPIPLLGSRPSSTTRTSITRTAAGMSSGRAAGIAPGPRETQFLANARLLCGPWKEPTRRAAEGMKRRASRLAAGRTAAAAGCVGCAGRTNHRGAA